MRCAWVRDRLLLYLASELDAGPSERLSHHLESCAGCAALAEDLAETQTRVQEAVPTDVEAPSTLDARVMNAVRGLPAPQRPWHRLVPRRSWQHRLTLAACAAAVVAAAFDAGWWSRDRVLALQTSHSGPAGAARQVELSELGGVFRQSALPSVKTSAPISLSQALTAQVHFPVMPVDLRAEGARLMGGRNSTLLGVPVALVVYDYGGRRVSLIQMDARRLSPRVLQRAIFGRDTYLVQQARGLTYVAWRTGHTNNVMVASAVPMHLLFRLGCHACEKQEQL